jgi:hypothetical protein
MLKLIMPTVFLCCLFCATSMAQGEGSTAQVRKGVRVKVQRICCELTLTPFLLTPFLQRKRNLQTPTM